MLLKIYILYSYAKSTVAEDKEWALQRFRQGRWYVVEPFGDTLMFAPSRFVGYKTIREKSIYSIMEMVRRRIISFVN